MDTTARIVDLLNFMAILVLSVAFHEMAHAWLADRFGDPTPREHGRISANPFVHVHPIYTVALPALLYWTVHSYMFMAATPVTRHRMRRPRLHGLLTALGGPAASLLLGAVCFVALVIFVVAVGGVDPRTEAQPGRPFWYFLMAVQLNVFGALFNLVPLPPLDGAAWGAFLLPRAALRWLEGLREYSWTFIFLLSYVGVFDPLAILAWKCALFGMVQGNEWAHGR